MHQAECSPGDQIIYSKMAVIEGRHTGKPEILFKYAQARQDEAAIQGGKSYK
jgi:hypothetical protein